jgi:hypothetical protein
MAKIPRTDPGIVGKAIEVLEQAVQGGDVRTVVEVLKPVKLYSLSAPEKSPYSNEYHELGKVSSSTQ